MNAYSSKMAKLNINDSPDSGKRIMTHAHQGLKRLTASRTQQKPCSTYLSLYEHPGKACTLLVLSLALYARFVNGETSSAWQN